MENSHLITFYVFKFPFHFLFSFSLFILYENFSALREIIAEWRCLSIVVREIKTKKTSKGKMLWKVPFCWRLFCVWAFVYARTRCTERSSLAKRRGARRVAL